MRGDSAQLPVDFLVGFTIFILSLIMVANFVPSLLVGLQRTSGIDYNAVAYRTGVVLVEDPGETNPAQLMEFPVGGNPQEFVGMNWQPWELMTDKNQQVSRFGLALSRETPNILSIDKIDRFFNVTFFPYSASQGQYLTDSDYRSMLLFSTYQYGYNVTLQNISSMKSGQPPLFLSIGQPYPTGSYGYIRRYVVLRQDTNATINMTDPYENSEFNAQNPSQICLTAGPWNCSEQFTIYLNASILYNTSIATPYIIDLQREPLIINITGLHMLLNNTAYNSNPIANNTAQWSPFPLPVNATLRGVDFGYPGAYNQWTNMIPNVHLVVDGNQTTFPVISSGVPVMDSINLSMDYVDANYFHANPGQDLTITFTFADTNPKNQADQLPFTLIHGTFLYDYNPRNVTQPVLSTGMLEVGIW